MRKDAFRPILLLLLVAAGSVACGATKPAGPPREEVRAKLDQEAQALKRDGEKGPDLGVKSTWTVEAVEIAENPGDPQRPWKGSIRMGILTRSQDATGVQLDRLQKTFTYTYSTVTDSWAMEYKPK